MRTVTIEQEVAEVLASAICEGARLKLAGQLDRKLYERTNKVLLALGAKWHRREAAHLFPGDAGAAIAEALGAGHAVDLKKSWEQFYTPAELAERMVAVARIQLGDLVLEPSCGAGNLLEPIDDDATIGGVVAIDIDAASIDRVRTRFEGHAWRLTTIVGDFLEIPALEADVVLMNPPFSNNQDIRHVLRAWDWLKPGGRLVAVTSPHWTFANDKASKAFRQWMKVVNGNADFIAAGTFRESGANVGARLVTAMKR